MSTGILFNLKRKLRKIVHNAPGKFLGEFRLLPIFFVGGACVEFAMIKWHVGEVNFYKTYKKNRIEEAVQERLATETQLN